MILPPIGDDGASVVKLPVGYKKPPTGELMLVPVPFGKCQHWGKTYEVDVKGNKCKCLDCGEEVSPIFVLEQLMHEESRWQQSRANYQEEMRRLRERKRTKCQHCGCLTSIRGS